MREFVPILDKSGDFPIIVTVGSSMGSIEDLKDGRAAHYRVSKVNNDNILFQIFKIFHF